MKVNYCGGAAQERMLKNGWRIELRKTVLHPGATYKQYETEDELYARLSEQYEDVRLYWTGTMVRGIHDIFAMVKNRKRNYI